MAPSLERGVPFVRTRGRGGFHRQQRYLPELRTRNAVLNQSVRANVRQRGFYMGAHRRALRVRPARGFTRSERSVEPSQLTFRTAGSHFELPKPGEMYG